MKMPQLLALIVFSSACLAQTNSPANPPGPPAKDPECKVAGCSSELCIEQGSENVVSACIYKEEFGCLKLSRCMKLLTEKKNVLVCGWEKNQAYLQCMAHLPVVELDGSRPENK